MAAKVLYQQHLPACMLLVAAFGALQLLWQCQ
jgi:hypothetical protein